MSGCNMQPSIDDLGYVDDLQQQENITQLNLKNCLQNEEEFWRKKSKISWHTQGDMNTRILP